MPHVTRATHHGSGLLGSLGSGSLFILGLLTCAAFAAAQTGDQADAADDSARRSVSVTAEVGVWPVDKPIGDDLLPVRVEITNDSEHALRVQYGDYVLVGDGGKRYAALPLYNVLLTGDEKPKPIAEIKSPKFGNISFRIAPGYQEIFPNTEAFPSHFGDQDYVEYYRSHWDRGRQPTVEMFEHLLPEGVIDAGGFVSGFLYFQKPEVLEPRLRLDVDLVDAEDGTSFGSLSLPLTAEDEAEQPE